MEHFHVFSARQKTRSSIGIIALSALFLSPLTSTGAAAADEILPPADYAIQGEFRVGQTLEISETGWTPSTAELSVVWSVGGTLIDDQSEAADPFDLTLIPSWLGETVEATITATADGLSDRPVTLSSDSPIAVGTWVLSAPTVTGSGRLGEVLIGAVSDLPEDATVEYVWTDNGSPISGATTAEFLPGEEHVGRTIRLQVTATRPGYENAQSTSAAIVILPRPDFPKTPTPTLPTTVIAGEPVSVSAGDWPAGTSLSFSYLVGDAIRATTTDDIFTFPASDIGAEARVRVTATHPDFASATVVSNPRKISGVFTISAPPTVVGTVRAGSTLSGKSSTSTPSGTRAFAWRVNGALVSSSATFTPKSSHVGGELTLTETITKQNYVTFSVSTTPVTITEGVFTLSPAPRVSGTAKVGSTLTATAGTWSPTASTSFQWFRNGTAISGATGSKLVLTSRDLNASITVRSTATLDGYVTKTVASAPVTVSAGAFSSAPVPKISGTSTVGSTLKATPGTWSPSATLKYQWLRNGVAISGATGSSYKTTAADFKAKITVKVTGSTAGYTTKTMTSAGTTIAEGTFAAAPTPKITGAAKVGSTLKATPGTWAPSATLKYQWLRNGSTISGATSSSYKPTATDLKAKITVRITGTSAGYTAKSVTSASVTIAAGTFSSLPTPKISGSARVGSTLKASAGAWAPTATLKYQWLRNGSAIRGATASSYSLSASDWATTISVKVTASRAGYVSSSRTSIETARVSKPFAKSATPTISGTTKVGSTLTANAGAWSPTAAYSYQWKRNGSTISGATSKSYKLDSADYGATLTVTVTASKATYVTASKTSAATAKVSAPAPVITRGGTYRVGTDIKPGTYTANALSGCYWERRSTAGSDFDGLISNAFVGEDGRSVVTILASDKYFKTDAECGAWTPLFKAGGAVSKFGNGTHVVNTHIRPGLYVSYTASEGCYWERLAGFSGHDYVDNDFTYDAPNYVQILASDVGFASERCGTWTRVSD